MPEREDQLQAQADLAEDPTTRWCRRWTFQAFERAVRLTGLRNGDLCAALAHSAGRDKPLSPQTLTDWRRGINPVPFEMFAAACYLARVDPRTVIALDPDAVPPTHLWDDTHEASGARPKNAFPPHGIHVQRRMGARYQD